MRLMYNGIHLKVTRLLECYRQDVSDASGQDYLHSLWRLVVEAIYAPDEYSLVQLPANRGTAHAAIATGASLLVSSHLAMILVTDFRVQLNG